MAISDYIEDLIYRVLAGEAEEVERKEFETWLRENNEHRVFFEKIERVWYTGKYATRWKNVEMSAAWKAVEHRHKYRRKRRFWQIGWGVAASVAVLVGITWLVEVWKEESSVFVETQSPVVQPGTSKARLVLSSGFEVELGCTSGDTINEKGGAILNGKEYIDYSKQEKNFQRDVVYNELIVPSGGEYRLVLSDRTVVYMNSESRLRYPVMFSGKNRTVELEGEAYFDVSKDENHPFIVRTERLDVTVLGTGFNVMAYKQDPRTEVTLVKGKVDVRSGVINEILTPSRQFVMNNENRKYEVKTVNVATYVDWKNGVLNFDGMSLEELGDKLGRWYEVKFFFTKESLKRLKFSGAFRKYNEIGYILSLIEATTNVSFKINKNVIVVNEK